MEVASPATPPSKAADKLVTENELMTFLYPPGQNHPSSASRLFLYARYGPLVHGEIVGGSYKRHRALTKQEQDDLIEQNESEELLALFLDPTVSRSLTPTEQAAVLSETRKIPHVQHALFNYTVHEVSAFLRHLRSVNALPEDADVPFGVLALAIDAEHDYRVQQLRQAHASLVAKRTRGSPLQRGVLFKRIGMAPPHGRQLAARVVRVGNVPLRADAQTIATMLGRYGVCEGVVIPSGGGGKVGSAYKATMQSEADADAAVAALHGIKLYGHKLSVAHELLAGQELDNFQVAERMLHKEAFSVATLETMNDANIRTNLSLLRPLRANHLGEIDVFDDYPVPTDQRMWDGLCCVRGANRGTFVEGAPHPVPKPAMSKLTELNTSPHVPTVLAATHRRISHHLHTAAEQGVHPPDRSPWGGASAARRAIAAAALSPETKAL